MTNNKIAIIGGGNLGTAIAEGLITADYCQPDQLVVTRRNTSALHHLSARGVQVINNNHTAITQARIIILAVKPYNFAEILTDLSPSLVENQHVLVSVVSGVWMEQLSKVAGKAIPIVRAMPNTAIAIRQSMTCLAFNGVSEADTTLVTHLFDRLGRTVLIDEKLMDAATVLGACGTAYAMRYIRANIQGGIQIGFDAKTATLIAAQTVLGAAELLLKTGSHPEQEIDKVTTPKGCTIAGLNEMEHQGFSSSLIKGITTSFEKINK